MSSDQTRPIRGQYSCHLINDNGKDTEDTEKQRKGGSTPANKISEGAIQQVPEKQRKGGRLSSKE